jgi:hypothetical protein
LPAARSDGHEATPGRSRRKAAMKPRLAAAAAKRLDEHRTLQTGPLAAAQKMLWEALLAGNIEEALKQADIVERIRGPQPPSPLALRLIERFNRMAAAAECGAGEVGGEEQLGRSATPALG